MRFIERSGLTVLAVALTLFSLPSVASADDGVDLDPAAGVGERDFNIQLAAGMRGGFSGVAGHGFENGEFVTDENGTRIPSGGQWGYPEYYGHFGTGGLSLEVRLNNIIGLETGLFYSRDNASGYVDKNHASTGTTIARIHSDQRTTAYHIPLMVKLNMPSDFVRPFLAVGVQFVAQVDSELEYRQENVNGQYGNANAMDELNDRNQIEPSTYPLLAGAAGIEVVVGPVRIPVELRLGYNLGYDQAMQQRARGEDGQIIYDGVYLGHFGIFMGALYEFDLLQ